MQLRQAYHHSFSCSLGVNKRTAVPARGRGGFNCARAAATTAASLDHQQQQFHALAALLCASPPLVTLGSTPLGRGLVVTEPVEPGTKLLETDAWATLLVADEPLRTGSNFSAAVLADHQALFGPLPPQLATYLQSSRGDWFRRLCAWLLWLSRHGPPGPWRTYLQLLPPASELPALMNYPPEERSELQLPQLIALAEQERVGIQGLHDSLFSSSTGELRALDLAPDLSDTLWAASMVNSRCFSDAAGREALSLMAPLADMANHSTEPNAAYALDAKQQTFSLTSTQPLQAGDEVLITYLGPHPTKSTAQLLKDYGMVLPGNPNDTIDFGGQAPPNTGEQQLLSPTLLLNAAAAAAAAAAPAGGDRDAAACTRRAQAVLRSLQPFVASTMAAAGPHHQPGGAAELVAGLQQQCVQQLQSLPTTIAEDEVLLGQQLSARQRAAIMARLEHKRLQATAKDVLQSYAAAAAAM